MDINGISIDSNQDTKAQITHDYMLEEKETEFKVTVVTKDGKAQKSFMVFYGKKPKPSANSFQLISILELANVDNVNSVPDNIAKKAATKAVLTVVPGYTIPMRETSLIKIRAILLREKYVKKDYSAKEISYSQLSAAWLEKNTLLGEIFGGLGLNDVRTDNGSVLVGADESAFETFFNTGLNQKLSKMSSWDLKWTYKLIDAKSDPADADDNADGGAWSLKTGLKYKIIGLKTAGEITYTAKDAKGKYQDNSSTKFKVKLNFPMGSLTPSWEYAAKDKTMKIKDIRKGVTPNYKTNTITVKIGYKLSSSLRLGFSYQNKENKSNVETAEFKASTIALSAMHIF